MRCFFSSEVISALQLGAMQAGRPGVIARPCSFDDLQRGSRFAFSTLSPRVITTLRRSHLGAVAMTRDPVRPAQQAVRLGRPEAPR